MRAAGILKRQNCLNIYKNKIKMLTKTKTYDNIQITKQTRPNYTRLPNRVQAVRKPIGKKEHEAWSKQELNEKREVQSNGMLTEK